MLAHPFRLTLASLAVLAAMATPAAADPMFSPIFIAIFGTATIGGFSVAAIATTIATALTVGLISWPISPIRKGMRHVDDQRHPRD